MTSSGNPVPLQVLFSRALRAASKASSLPTIDDETQECINAALADLRQLSVRIDALHLFSRNETLEDISTKDLVYISVPYVLAEVEASARATERDERKSRLRKAEAYFRSFISLLDAYEVIPADEQKLYARKSFTVTDPAKRREMKIAQFKKEKEIKTKIADLRARRGKSDLDMTDAYELIDSLLPALTSKEDDDEDDEDVMRDAVLLLLRLQRAKTSAHLESIDQELELLLNAPPEDPRENLQQRKQGDDTWKLDASPRNSLANQQGPLLDVSGKPLRPFTILPAAAAERARLQSGVFRPDHRLPTMTIDEYLQEEQRRGNIISGGGVQSAAAPTKKEQLALDAEMDGTLEGDENAEEKRLEEERWARYTDANPRGAGNTMNRG